MDALLKWARGHYYLTTTKNMIDEAETELAALKSRLAVAEGLLDERLHWDQYWLGDYPEKTLGPDGAFSLEHWQIKVKAIPSPPREPDQPEKGD